MLILKKNCIYESFNLFTMSIGDFCPCRPQYPLQYPRNESQHAGFSGSSLLFFEVENGTRELGRSDE